MSPTTRRQARAVALFLLVVLLFVTSFRMAVVRGNSMEPTYHDGQVVLVRRRGWLSPPLRRGDVVLLRKDRDVIIKRIFRLPGDVVDDTPLDRRALARGDLADYYEQQTLPTPRGPETHLTVPDHFLVVLGDNARVSEDSRIFGPVPERDVLGTVIGAPPSPNGVPSGHP
ncbi:MAG TPA: signal peptidase I [Chthonomonadaceae bacterium]|nr:signal peptidase I [Chthonomonadaceae bacterium]